MNEESKKLIDELNRLYASGEMTDGKPHAEPEEQEKPTPSLSPALLKDVEDLLERLRQANVPFLLSLVSLNDEQDEKRSVKLTNYAWSPGKLCEHLAAQVVLSFPHEFSHIVLEMAQGYAEAKALLGLLRAVFGKDEEHGG